MISDTIPEIRNIKSGFVVNLQKLRSFLNQQSQSGSEFFRDLKILLTRRCSQGVIIRYKHLINVRVSSKGKLMITTLGKKSAIDESLPKVIVDIKKKMAECVANFVEL